MASLPPPLESLVLAQQRDGLLRHLVAHPNSTVDELLLYLQEQGIRTLSRGTLETWRSDLYATPVTLEEALDYYVSWFQEIIARDQHCPLRQICRQFKDVFQIIGKEQGCLVSLLINLSIEEN